MSIKPSPKGQSLAGFKPTHLPPNFRLTWEGPWDSKAYYTKLKSSLLKLILTITIDTYSIYAPIFMPPNISSSIYAQQTL